MPLQITVPKFPFEWMAFFLSNPVGYYTKLKVLLELYILRHDFLFVCI